MMEGSGMGKKRNKTILVSVIVGVIVVLAFMFGNLWLGRNAKEDTEKAVRSVSSLYLDELAGRREQVVERNLENRINDLQVAIGLMTEADLKDDESLQSYQSRMKQLYKLEAFAFVDTKGVIHTSLGNRDNIDDYQFDYKTI